MTSVCYAGYPYARLHEAADPHSPARRQLLWGDRMEVQEDKPASDFVKVACRDSVGYVHRAQAQAERLLDVIFLDVGQGDSAVMVTPAGDRVLVDFGQDTHTLHFLHWRYSGLADVRFAAAVLSHGDLDHYGGLAALCDTGAGQEKFTFDTLFHNGLFEGTATARDGRHTYYTQLIDDRRALAALRGAPTEKDYYQAIVRALDSGRVRALRRLSAADEVLPGLTPVDGLRVEVLGPVTEPAADGTPRLRALGGGYSPTKNGHSVILRVIYRDLRVLLGGDLNSPAEELVLAHYAGGATGAAAQAAVAARLGSDVVKSFHHGSGDFAVDFLRALAPVATVISSGDHESFSHPRADALGAIGRWSRGDRPLVFCTELARSTAEHVNLPLALARKLAAAPDAKHRTAIAAELGRSVSRYGAINLRSDGRRVVLAQKLEKPSARAGATQEWDLYALDRASGDWAAVSPPPRPSYEREA